MRAQVQALVTLLICTFFVVPSDRCFAHNPADSEQASARYKTTVKLPLSQALNGVDGYLELRQDARLTPKLIGRLWGTGGINIDDDPELAMFRAYRPSNGIIQIVDRSGQVLAAKTLEHSLAKLRTAQLYGDARLTYVLTVDYSAGSGSYNGPITSLFEVKNAHLSRVDATDSKTGKTEEISLMKSLKTTWEFVNAPDGKGKQILLAECRPDWSSVKDDPDFTTQYARFYFDGTKWLARVRTVKGISEFDEGFPSRKNFP